MEYTLARDQEFQVLV